MYEDIVISRKKLCQSLSMRMHSPDLSIRSDPARSTTTSLLFLTIGGRKDPIMEEECPFSADILTSISFLPFTALLTFTFNKGITKKSNKKVITITMS
jgi:hypothetical protein